MKKFLHPIAVFLIFASVALFGFCGYYGSETTNGKICFVIGLILIFVSVIVEFISYYLIFCENEEKEKNRK